MGAVYLCAIGLAEAFRFTSTVIILTPNLRSIISRQRPGVTTDALKVQATAATAQLVLLVYQLVLRCCSVIAIIRSNDRLLDPVSNSSAFAWQPSDDGVV